MQQKNIDKPDQENGIDPIESGNDSMMKDEKKET